MPRRLAPGKVPVPLSPELAGGAGFTFEDAVVAAYLTALLQEGYAPGVENRTVSRVALQQRDFGEPLDDVIVDFRAGDGAPARLSLQVKRALTISKAATNSDFREVIRDSWNTLAKGDFRKSTDRFGAAVGEIASDKARALRSICELARASVEPAEFERRFEGAGNTNALLREIREDIIGLIEEVSGAVCPAASVHQFLAHFVLIEFDFMHEGGTSIPNSLNALRSCLAADQQAQAPSAWATLCQLAREEAGRSGVFDRPRLVRELAPKIRLAVGLSWQSDFEKLRRLTAQWLADIEDDVGGARFDRANLLEALKEKLAASRVVQIRGLPGSGKSVLLRRRVEADVALGPVLLLKSGRLEGTGWTSFAKANGLSGGALTELLVEIGATGSSTLYIDGIDRVEKQHQPIIRDVVRAIMTSSLLDNWRVVVSLRDTGIEPLRNWIGDLLTPSGIGTLEVPALDDNEAELLAVAKPHLRKLLFGPQPVREIVRRPFFAKVLDQNFGASAGNPSFQPQSEVDLISNWWIRGGYNAEGQVALERQRAIIELGSIRARHLEREIAIGQLSAPAVGVVSQFVADGILQYVRPGHTIRFAHDIFFEWAFFHVLTDRGANWLEEIRACGEPPAAARTVELVSQSEFGQGAAWAATLQNIAASGMRSQWARAWLLAPLAAPNFEALEATFRSTVEGNECHFLRKALVWFQAEKTTPNPNVLAGDLPPDQRIRVADLLGWPSDFAAWRRFISYLLARSSIIPVAVLPDVVSVFEVWQNALSGLRNPISDALLDQVALWLQEIEGEDAAETPRATTSRWNALGSARDDFRQSLTSLILRSAPFRPDLAKDYLERVIASEKLRREKYTEIVAFSPVIAQSHSRLLVDLTLKHLKEELPEDRRNRERQEARRHSQYRKRALTKPPEERTRNDELILAGHMSILGGSSFSYHDWEALAVDRDTENFWPPSPLREPFHSLFSSAPDQALRLVAQLSNHAITAWRQLHSLTHDRPGTPLPLSIAFPWGTQYFWGSDREYLWCRGTWAPKALACAYTALEDWMLKELERGRPADDLIQQLVASNECIAVLGAAVAIALQAEAISEVVFPLVTSQRLLTADYNRMIHDFTDASAGLIGFRDKSELPHVEAISAANARSVRKKHLRQLLSMYFLNGKFMRRTEASVLSFPDNLPFQIEEHRSNSQVREHLLREARELAELVRLENYRKMKLPEDDQQVAIVHVSPTAVSPERVERAKEAEQKLREGNLWAWASKYFESGTVGDQFTIPSAIEFAKHTDRPALYEGTEGNEENSMRRGAVAAAAAVVLHRREEAMDADLEWARDVLQRAMHTPEKRDLLWSPSSVIPWHPVIFVARGLAADIRFGTADRRSPKNLLKLVAHPLEGVSLVAIDQALSLWDVMPRLGWSALLIALSLCRIPRRQRSEPGEPVHTPEEVRSLLKTAVRCYEKATGWTDLPLPPPAWVKVERDHRHGRSRRILGDDDVGDDDVLNPAEVWGEPPTYWYSQYASKVLASVPFERILASEAGPNFLEFLSGLLTWTTAKVSPPWVKPGRRDRSSARLYEWTHELGRSLGKVCGFLALDEARTRFIEPIFALDDERCWDLLAPLVETHICVHIYDAKQVPDEAPALLRLCVERLLEDRAFDAESYRAGELHGFDLPRLAKALMFVSVEHAALAARYVNGDWSEIGHILPIVDRFVRAAGWSSAIMFHYLTLCERAKAAYPADQFADQILHVIEARATELKGWHGTILPARIAGLVQQFADRKTPMPLVLGQKLLRILDLLVDMGDRRSAALQLSESFREIQTVQTGSNF